MTLKKVIKPQEKRTREDLQNNQKTSYKTAIIIHLSMITLKVNRLNSLIKSHGVAEWIKTNKQNKTQLYAFYKRPTSDIRIHID